MIRHADSHDLPPSAKYVRHVIANEGDGELTRQEIIEHTGLTERTIDRALKTLENGDCIFRARKSEDLRQVVCQIRGEPDI